MFVLVDKNTCEVEEVRGSHLHLPPNTTRTAFSSWYGFFHWLFKHSCIVCGDIGTQIHHIVPRSHGEEALHWKNQVLICSKCHEIIHQGGITKKGIVELQRTRSSILKSYGREGYI